MTGEQNAQEIESANPGECHGWYIISGRVPGDDDDTIKIIEAEDLKQAEDSFRSKLTDNLTDADVAYLDQNYDTTKGVYIMLAIFASAEPVFIYQCER